MRVHSSKKIVLVRKYRKMGYSIHELMDKFSMPKTTVWHHIQGVGVPEKYKKILKARQGGSKIRSQKEWEQASNEAQSILKNLEARNMMPVILASLYWGEGKKRGGFLFTNTDEKMIKVFMKILRNYFYIKDENIQAVVRICDPMDPSECIKYWKNVTNLSLENIKLNRNNRQNKSKTKYGMCRIIIKKGGYMLKLTSCLITEMAHKINTT